MNIKSIFAFGIVFLIPTHVLAEFTCKTNISYSWRRGESEENVHWVHLWEKSQDQDAAKQKLVELGIAERAKAMSACR
ncbi:MAG: hypothetical protein KDD53_12220, partial [Bdellovibrionales bacterium]|nr:hypothetical protein [Bdellovibrionales bacterium]